MSTKTRVFRITVPSVDVQGFLAECGHAQWYAFDTGERIMTDEGPDADAVLLVEPSARTHTKTSAPIAQ